MTLPTFSIVIPAYNSASAIHVALDSVASMDRGRVEVIVVDDGSTDELGSVLAGYPWIAQIVRQVNNGVCRARNRGASVARGDYLVFLDADDALLADWFDAFSRAATRRPPSIHCGVELVDVASDCVRVHDIGPMGAGFNSLLATALPGAYAVRRSSFEVVGGFAPDLRYGEHHELWMRLSALPGMVVGSVGLTEALVRKFHDRRPERVASYDKARRQGAEYVLDAHASILRNAPELRADLHAVAGVAAARLGDHRGARQHLRRAMGSRDRFSRHLFRYLVSLTPSAGNWFWSRRG